MRFHKEEQKHCQSDLFRMEGFPPADDEADSGRQEPRAKAAVEPGDEGVRDLWDAFEGYPQRNHEGNDDVPLDAECLEDGCLGLRHGLNTFGVFSDNAGEHNIESGKDEYLQQVIPPMDFRKSQVITDSRKEYLNANGAPEEAIEKNEMSGGNLEHYFL